MKPYKCNIFISFISGTVFSSGLSMYKQDSMGLFPYIEHVKNNWIELPIIFSALLMLLSLFILLSCVTSRD